MYVYIYIYIRYIIVPHYPRTQSRETMLCIYIYIYTHTYIFITISLPFQFTVFSTILRICSGLYGKFEIALQAGLRRMWPIRELRVKKPDTTVSTVHHEYIASATAKRI